MPPASSRLTDAMPGGLGLVATSDPDDGLLDLYYRGYDAAFVLEAEKETLDGFRDCLALNRSAAGRRLMQRHGRFCELVVLARADDGAHAPIVGGANLTAFAGDGAQAPSIALNYVHVLDAHRGRGASRGILHGCSRLALRALGLDDPAQAPPLVFIEQHDPARLAPGDLDRDRARAGLGPFERLRIWERLGFRLLDLPYVQPPLVPGGEPADNLLLAVHGAAGDALDACVVGAHLTRFFAVSCLKGRPIETEPSALGQLGRLEGACAAGRRVALQDLAARFGGAGHAGAGARP